MTATIDTTVTAIDARLASASAVLNPRLSAFMRVPAAVLWNRIEGRPRSGDLTLALRAEVRDPLWLLARQWQFGEFAGEDAGMPVSARIEVQTSALTSVSLNDAAPQAYNPRLPLEAVVEQRPIEPDLIAGVHIGRRWRALLAQKFGAGDSVIAGFDTVYAIKPPIAGGKDLAALQLATHRRELALRMALAGRSIDGAQLYSDIVGALRAGESPAARFAARGVVMGSPQQSTEVDALAAGFPDLLGLGLAVRTSDDAWVAERLEHRFGLGAGTGDGMETRLVADRYPGGRLDWYSVDFDAPRVAAVGNANVQRQFASFVPTPIRFGGMPNVRWWEFEDRRVGFGLTTAAKTDLVKLLLAQFALVFSNDWFILPFSADVGTVIDTRAIVVTDNFGVNTLIEPTALRGASLGLAGRWQMWGLHHRDTPATIDTRMFLAPALGRSQQSAPLDEVVFLRDEMANLVWGVEAIIPDPLGGGRDARGAGKLLREAIAVAYPDKALEVQNAGSDILLQYRLMGQVPENWIPFVSVKLAGQDTATALLQGAMPRVPALSPPVGANAATLLANAVIVPRGTLLGRDPVGQPNLILEEEILRGGAVVRRTIQRARGIDGSTTTWSSRETRNGRGEGSSGLYFDHAVVKPQ